MAKRSVFKGNYRHFKFDKNFAKNIKSIKRSTNWPVVYFLYDKKRLYVGETQDALSRMAQHKKDPNRKSLNEGLLIYSDEFNKSAILDLENQFISHLNAENTRKMLNQNAGQSRYHDYYQKFEYRKVFYDIWDKMYSDKTIDLVKKKIYEIENDEIFKYSPYKQLTDEQFECVTELNKKFADCLKNNKQEIFMIEGAAGTGKTVIALYFLCTLLNLLDNKYDDKDLDLEKDEDFSFEHEILNYIKEKGSFSIAFVEPVESFRKTINKVVKLINGRYSKFKLNVLKASDVLKKEEGYDLIVVDEAHRLKKRTYWYKQNNMNRSYGFNDEANELDWLIKRSNKLLVLFFDKDQKVKNNDVNSSDFDIIRKKSKNICNLKSQLRVNGGNEYIEFIKGLFNNENVKYKIKNEKNKNYYDLKIFDNVDNMFKAILSKNREYNGLCRVFAGYDYEWKTDERKPNSTKYRYDINIDNKYYYKWNRTINDSNFILKDSEKKRVGCIYTCQGYDLNYAGVILGPDIRYDSKESKIVYDPNEFRDYKAKESLSNDETIKIIINQYLILLTRGVYGTYIYCVDKELRNFLKYKIKK